MNTKPKNFSARTAWPFPTVPSPFPSRGAKAAADGLGAFPVVVKAQIHAGGRGLGGGVKVARTAEEFNEFANGILGMNLVTKQTGPGGKQVKKLLVEQGLNIAKELYLSILPDRATAKMIIMASEAGGMDIEDVAEKTPEKIIKVYVDPNVGIQGYHLRAAAFGLNMPKASMKPFTVLLKNLYNLAVNYDCSLVEINPLIITAEDDVIALDGKMDFDDNALYRHPDVKEYRDLDEEDPTEVEAGSHGLNYIHLGEGGNVGQHGQRRRAGHGHHGLHQVRRRQSGQLSGRGRRCQRRADRKRLPHPSA